MTRASVDATDAPVVEIEPFVAQADGSVMQDRRASRQPHAPETFETGARVAMTGPSVRDDGPVRRDDRTRKIEKRQPGVPKNGFCSAYWGERRRSGFPDMVSGRWNAEAALGKERSHHGHEERHE